MPAAHWNGDVSDFAAIASLALRASSSALFWEALSPNAAVHFSLLTPILAFA